MKSRKRLAHGVFNLILLPDIQALFMTLLVQVARHKMEAFMAGFQDLIFFFFFLKQVEKSG